MECNGGKRTSGNYSACNSEVTINVIVMQNLIIRDGDGDGNGGDYDLVHSNAQAMPFFLQ